MPSAIRRSRGHGEPGPCSDRRTGDVYCVLGGLGIHTHWLGAVRLDVRFAGRLDDEFGDTGADKVRFARKRDGADGIGE